MNSPSDRLVQELLLLQRVVQRINSILDVETLLERIVDDVAETFGYSRTAILLLDEEQPEDLVIAAVRGWTRFHEKGHRFKIGKEGMVGHVASTGEMHYARDVRVDPYYCVSEEETRSEVDIPLKTKGRLIGVFNAQHTKVDGFPPDQLQILEVLAGHVSTAIDNARLFQMERREKQRLTKELATASAIQAGLFPQHVPEIPGFALTGLCVPCREVGGDWYDYINLPRGRLGIVVADVSGKGLGAAFLMSSARSMLRLVAERARGPGEALTRVNQRLLDDLPEGRFITMIFAVLDPASGNLVLSNAGHPWPLMADMEGVRFLDEAVGLPLGIRSGVYSEQRVDLPRGSRVFLYSDGVTEAANASSAEYGSSRLREHLVRRDSSCESLLADVRQFSATPGDDVTIVKIERIGPP
jgi:sigma-B regulation protein RsbU (phosphoserine phosphatase)